MSDDPAPQNVRSDLWAATSGPWKQGLLEHAIFDAFKYVEAELQRRIGSQAIGNTLIHEAFAAGGGSRVDIAANPIDEKRVGELFEAALGLFKGSRSHGGQTPSIPAAHDPEFATRILVVASALLDLLDRDTNLAPAFRGEPQVQDGVLIVWVDRLTPSTRVEVDSQEVGVQSRVGDCLEVALSQIAAGTHEVRLTDGIHASRARSFQVPATPAAENWHKVLKTDVPIYADAACAERRQEVAILLESLEGGHRYRRVFPSASAAQPGDYVSWEWSTASPVPESWVKLEGESLYAWTWSGFFEGVPTSPTEIPRVTHIAMRPRRMRLRPGACLPLRLFANWTDGVATWKEPLTSSTSISSTEDRVGYVDKTRIVRAKASGRCDLRADAVSMHAEVELIVAAHPAGTVTEYLGGVQHPRDIAFHDGNLFLVDNGDTIWWTSEQRELAPFATVDLPYLAASGLDQVTISSSGNVAARDLSTRRYVCVATDDPSRSIALGLPDDGVTPMACAWHEEALVVADHTGGVWVFEDAMTDGAVPVARLKYRAYPNPIGASVKDGLLYLLVGSGGGLFALDLEDGQTVERLSDGAVTGLASFTVDDDDVWACDFSGGSVWRRVRQIWHEVASGLQNPGAIALSPDGAIFVAEFGGDAVLKILA